MRYLLLLLLFFAQANVFGYSNNDLQKSNVKKELTSKKSNLKARSYELFRYYSPDTGSYISQDPIGLAGNNPNFYAYTHDSNSFVDPFGLINWGAHLTSLTGEVAPAGMKQAHGHHIVFKKGIGKIQQAIVNQSKAILEKHGIDWLMGKENLVHAPNVEGLHTKKVAQKVLDALQKADKIGKNAVIDALDDLGKKAADLSICK